MPALASTSRAIARTWTQHSLPVARAGCTAMQTRNASDAPASFNSPFKGAESTTRIPSFGAYRNKSKGEMGPKMMQYFMVGTMGALASLGAKATVQGRSTLHTLRELRMGLEMAGRI
jgi:ubiquinol-cytochrome c reductase iron-sulfur subunit